MKWAQKKQGFTIVELLIVVVVIVILAAITIVAYNGISDRAKHSSAQSATSQVAKKLEAYAIQNSDNYPAQLSDIDIIASGGTSYNYDVNNASNPKEYCVTVTVQNVSYYQNNTTARKPTAGACPGHGINGLAPNLAVNSSFDTPASAITTRTNLLSNPTFESGSTAGWGIANGGTGATIAASTNRAHSGSNSLLYTYGDSTHQDSGPGSSISAVAGSSYTVSAWVYAPAAISTGVRIVVHGTAIATSERGVANVTVGSWTRISYTVNATASGTLNFNIVKASSTTDTGKLLYVDSVMIENSPGLSDYFSGASSADGDFTYVWNGTANASSSAERAPNIANYNLNGSGGARMQSSVRSTEGATSARVLINNTAMNPGLYQNRTMEPGTYTFISKVWLESGLTGSVTLTAQGTGVTVGSVSGYPLNTTTKGEWIELRRTVMISSATSANFFAYISGATSSVARSFWVDEFAIVPGDCTSSACY